MCICNAKRSDFPQLSPSEHLNYRDYQEAKVDLNNHGLLPLFCLLTYKNIVPLPLHLFLGLCNQMIGLLVK